MPIIQTVIGFSSRKPELITTIVRVFVVDREVLCQVSIQSLSSFCVCYHTNTPYVFKYHVGVGQRERLEAAVSQKCILA
jgi:hypothetical protein